MIPSRYFRLSGLADQTTQIQSARYRWIKRWFRSRRPGFSHAAPPERAKPLYEYFLACLSDLGYPPEHGEFGTDMQVASVNDGPVTLLLEM